MIEARTSNSASHPYTSVRQAERSTGNVNHQPANEPRVNTNNATGVELGVGDRGRNVQQAQQSLDEAGHSPGPIDGQFGPKTAAAALAFQLERIDSLQQTIANDPPPAARSVLTQQIGNLQTEIQQGIIGDETLLQLDRVNEDATVRQSRPTDLGVGDRGTDVLVAQQALEDAGHSPGAIDGDFGPNTLRATQAFQQARIDSIQQTLDNGPPPAARGVLTQRISELRDEMAQGVIGSATQAQLGQLDRDATVTGSKDVELGIGSRGGDVVNLQEQLVEAGFTPGVADGIFGPNTAAATNAFQQERIDSLQQTIDNGPPPLARSVLQEQLNNLREEQAQRVAGAETKAQLQQLLAPIEPPPESIDTDDSDQPEPDTVPTAQAPDLPVPDFENLGNAVDSARQGDIDRALEQGLNSEGDTVAIKLGATVKAPGSIVGFEGELAADVTVVDGGYELSLSAEAAASVGLAADANDLGIGAELGAGAKVSYRFDSIDEVKQGVKDLVITAGKNEQVQQAVELGAKAAELGNNVADSIGDYIDNLGFPLGPVARRVTGDIDRIVDQLVETLPDRIGFTVAGQFIGLPIDGLKENLQELDRLRANVETGLQDISNAQKDAIDRLDSAYESVEVSGSVGAFGNIGIPSPVELENVGLTASARIDQELTGTFNRDGSVSVDFAYTGTGTLDGGFGIGGEVTSANSVTFSQEFQRVNGRFVRDGGVEAEFRADLEAIAKVGAGVTLNGGVGGELSFTVDAEDAGGNLANAAIRFLNGDVNGALGDLGGIEGDVEINGRAIAGSSFSAGGDLLGAELSAEGDITVEDHAEALNIGDVSLEEAFDFLNEEVESAFNEFQDELATAPA